MAAIPHDDGNHIRGGCLMHSGHEARILEIERSVCTMEKKQAKSDAKLNILLGGVLVLWPAVQILMWVLGKKP